VTQTISTYQRLRSHLAYLRLGAAAEALPGELERAGKDDLSHTTFLERLLAVEVTATEERRLAGRRRFSCLPAPYRLEDFDFEAQPRAAGTAPTNPEPTRSTRSPVRHWSSRTAV
jgi:hypothetical protein